MTARPIIKLPFAGFYESMYSGEIDYRAENQVDYERERTEDHVAKELRLTDREIADILFDVTDYNAAYAHIAREYVASFDNVVSNELDFPLRLDFEAMKSPREYNFETDRIFAFTTHKALGQLFKMSKADKHVTLAAIVKKRCTSRSGFISFYSNDVDTWLAKPFRNWDHNELEILLAACCKLAGLGDADADRTLQDEIFDHMQNSGDFDTAYDNAVDWNAFEAKRDELRADKVREAQEMNPDYVAPPERCLITIDMFTGRAGPSL